MCKTNLNLCRGSVKFKCFQRKGYSLFNCLGREVLISVLSVATLSHAAANGMSTVAMKSDTTRQATWEISLDDIADTLHISPTYLSHLFRKEVGMCLQDYVNKLRVERAANLLVYSDKSLYDIAVYVHFPNQSYFGKMFKRYMNMTPKAYRDINKVGEYIEKAAVSDNMERLTIKSQAPK